MPNIHHRLCKSLQKTATSRKIKSYFTRWGIQLDCAAKPRVRATHSHRQCLVHCFIATKSSQIPRYKWHKWGSCTPWYPQWGLCALRHGIQISMEAILACHPARSTEWLAGWQIRVNYDVFTQAPSNANGSHFGLLPSSNHSMTGLGGMWATRTGLILCIFDWPFFYFILLLLSRVALVSSVKPQQHGLLFLLGLDGSFQASSAKTRRWTKDIWKLTFLHFLQTETHLGLEIWTERTSFLVDTGKGTPLSKETTALVFWAAENLTLTCIEYTQHSFRFNAISINFGYLFLSMPSFLLFRFLLMSSENKTMLVFDFYVSPYKFFVNFVNCTNLQILTLSARKRMKPVPPWS